MKVIITLLGLFLTTATLADSTTPNIMEVVQNVRQEWISTFLQAVRVAGLIETLQKGKFLQMKPHCNSQKCVSKTHAFYLEYYTEAGPLMVFAPLNGAFNKLPEGALAKLIASPADLKKLLMRHIVKGNTEYGDLKSGDFTNLEGETLKITVLPGTSKSISLSIDAT